MRAGRINMADWNVLLAQTGGVRQNACRQPKQCPPLWPSGIGAHLERTRLRVRVLAVSDI